MRHGFNKIFLLTTLAGTLFTMGCELEEGWPWFRNMHDSPGPQPQEEALYYPDHTLPVEGGEFTDFQEVEGTLMNQEKFEITGEFVERGEALYDQFCMVCHGRNAKGLEMTDDFFTPDLTEEDYLDYSDEDLYYLLIDGGLSMPSYREELNVRERWLVINHLRRLQGKHD